MNWSPTRTLIIGLALIIGVNLVVLAGVFYNRSGPAESTLTLSERELTLDRWRDNKEDSSISLQIAWRALPPEPQTGSETPNNSWRYGWYQGEVEWLNAAKMATLGFTREPENRFASGGTSFGRRLPRDVLLVLENDGAAYQTALARAIKYNSGSKEDARLLEEERNKNSRLFVVDAGLDLAVLRAVYADQRRYAIVRGQIRPSWNATSRDRANDPPKLTGMVSKMNIDRLNVSLELRSVFEGMAEDTSEDAFEQIPPSTKVASASKRRRYAVDISFGQRLEPWITSAARK